MRTAKIVFRLRTVIMLASVMAGFWAPWIKTLGIGRRISLWEWLALEASRQGHISFTVAVPLFIGIGALLAAAGVILRVWGAAYLGINTVGNKKMLADVVLTDGPYRFMRNPLYAGSWFMFAAMAFLMPVTGAVIAVTLLTILFLRLILDEEAFLGGEFGPPYHDYLRSVPRLFPTLRSVLGRTGAKPSGRQPQWMNAVLSQFMAIGTFITLAVFYWDRNIWLLAKVLFGCLIVSLLAQNLWRRTRKHTRQTV